MYPYYTGYVEGMELHSDDIAAIQSLYGNVLEFVRLFVLEFFPPCSCSYFLPPPSCLATVVLLLDHTCYPHGKDVPNNEFLGIKNGFLYPSVSIKEKNLDITQPGYIANTCICQYSWAFWNSTPMASNSFNSYELHPQEQVLLVFSLLVFWINEKSMTIISAGTRSTHQWIYKWVD